MKLTDAILGEHGAFYALFDHVEELATSAGGVAQIQGAMTVLETMVLTHATLEEGLLFATLDPLMDPDDKTLTTMKGEHREMEVLLGRIEDSNSIEDAVSWVIRALRRARRHFKSEEEILLPLTLKLVDDETLEILGDKWTEARRLTLA